MTNFLRVLALLLLSTPAFAVWSTSNTEFNDTCNAAGVECFVIAAQDNGGDDANGSFPGCTEEVDCTYANPCENPEVVEEECMTGTNKQLWILDGSMFLRTTHAMSEANATVRGQSWDYFMVASNSCGTDAEPCVIRAETLKGPCTDGFDCREIFDDIDGNGTVDYEPTAAFYCEDDFMFHTPTTPPRDRTNQGGLAFANGVWEMKGIALLCDVGAVFYHGSDHEISQNLIWVNPHVSSTLGGLYIGDKNQPNRAPRTHVHHNAITSPGHEAWVMDSATGDSLSSPVTVEGDEDLTAISSLQADTTIEMNYIMGGGTGPAFPRTNGLLFSRNVAVHVPTHGWGRNATNNFERVNNVLCGLPTGSCADRTQRVCSFGGTPGADCSCVGSTDRNGDGCNDDECWNGTLGFCKFDPEKLSQKICLDDTECSGGVTENMVFPTTTTYGASVPAALSSVHAGSTNCWRESHVCEVTGATVGASECGIKTDWRPTSTGSGGDGFDGDSDFGLVANGQNMCSTAGSGGHCIHNLDVNCDGSIALGNTGSCLPSSPDYADWRIPRLEEPNGDEDNSIDWFNTCPGYGYGLGGWTNIKSAWQGGKSCNADQRDCVLTGHYDYSNVIGDALVTGFETVYYKIPNYKADANYDVSANDYKIDHNTFFVHGSYAFTRATIVDDAAWSQKFFRGWGGVNSTSVATSIIDDETGTCGSTTDDAEYCTQEHNAGDCAVDRCDPANGHTDCATNTVSGFTWCFGAVNNEHDDSWVAETPWCDNCQFIEDISAEVQDYADWNLVPTANSILRDRSGTGPGITANVTGANVNGEQPVWTLPTVDFYGRARDSTPDAGAFEYFEEAPPVSATPGITGGTVTGGKPN